MYNSQVLANLGLIALKTKEHTGHVLLRTPFKSWLLWLTAFIYVVPFTCCVRVRRSDKKSPSSGVLFIIYLFITQFSSSSYHTPSGRN